MIDRRRSCRPGASRCRWTALATDLRSATCPWRPAAGRRRGDLGRRPPFLAGSGGTCATGRRAVALADHLASDAENLAFLDAVDAGIPIGLRARRGPLYETFIATWPDWPTAGGRRFPPRPGESTSRCGSPLAHRPALPRQSPADVRGVEIAAPLLVGNTVVLKLPIRPLVGSAAVCALAAHISGRRGERGTGLVSSPVMPRPAPRNQALRSSARRDRAAHLVDRGRAETRR